MKKNYLLTLFSLLFCSALKAQVTYSGNGNSGFGGNLGNATLNVSDNGTDVTFAFDSNAGGNVFVVYIDSKSGGFSDTESFTDNSDGGRRAVSTIDGANNPSVNFPAGFTADYAIAMGGAWAALFELNTGSFVASGLTFSSNSTSVTFAQLGTNATSKFDFVVTLNSESTFLSNETIGTATVGGNPGFSGNITFTESKSYPNTWTGTTDSDWATATNWTEGVPSTTHNVYIPAVTNHPIAAAAVTINKGVIKSGASLIAQDAFTGTITYERNLPTLNWYLISSPVSWQAYNDAYVTANGIASGEGSNRGIATYTTSTNQWAYLQAAGSGTFNNGQGYSVKRTASGDISFTGTINTADVTGVAVSTALNGFNLVGNPYTSHMNSGTFLTANTNLTGTIWVWNQATSNYITHVTVDNFMLAPTQGFFVQALSGSTVNFTESNQSTSGGTFQKSARTEVKLLMNDGSADRFAKMYYLENVTKGFDNGFDGETFGGIENEVDVFTNLLENNEGKKFQIQSLPIAEMETMIVPVGVKAAAGKEITFTADAMNLPNDLKVFLEDRLTNTVTRLDEANSSYKVTLNDAINGTGRFYLHTKASGVLSTDELALSNTSVYATANNTLRVVGLPSGNATVKVFTVLGKQVVQTSFSSTGSYDVSLPKLATGMYIVQLETATGKLNKKIVLE